MNSTSEGATQTPQHPDDADGGEHVSLALSSFHVSRLSTVYITKSFVQFFIQVKVRLVAVSRSTPTVFVRFPRIRVCVVRSWTY